MSDINWPVQSEKQARRLKIWIYVEEALHYTCSENKDADQLCSYCTADLRLFSPTQIVGFLMQWLKCEHDTTQLLIATQFLLYGK